MCIHDISKNENTAQNNLCSAASNNSPAVYLNNWIHKRTVQCESYCLIFWQLHFIQIMFGLDVQYMTYHIND